MKQQLVVVGNGMAGVSCVEQILKQNHGFEITIFGDETHVNYNRILLSLVLAGEKSPEEIVINDVDWYKNNDIKARLGVKIVAQVGQPQRRIAVRGVAHQLGGVQRLHPELERLGIALGAATDADGFADTVARDELNATVAG